MFQLNDDFLQSIGVGSLPEEQKKELLRHIYEELELRVGEKLAAGMSEAQMKEFEAILDRDEEKIRGWLDEHAVGYETAQDYLQFVQNLQAAGREMNVDALADYTATKWLEVNRPDYRDVVAETMEEIRKEIVESRDAILAEK